MNRDALIEAMAKAACDRMDSESVSTWNKLSERNKDEWRQDMRTALAVAEPVVRENERDECVMRLQFASFDHGASLPDYVAAIRTGGTP